MFELAQEITNLRLNNEGRDILAIAALFNAGESSCEHCNNFVCSNFSDKKEATYNFAESALCEFLLPSNPLLNFCHLAIFAE